MFTPDYTSYLALISVDKLLPWPDEWELFQRWIRERQAMVEAGILRCPPWFQEELTKIDSRLRAWWDSEKDEWVIDRLQDAGIAERLVRAARHEAIAETAESMQKSAATLLDYGNFYCTLIHFKPRPGFQLDQGLLDMLKAADMQAVEPAEYMAKKQDAAERAQQQNDVQGTDRVKAVIDAMSEKQVQQFLEVSEAIESGETVVAHGPDLRWVEHAYQETLKEENS